jgi:hypothetical protein
MSKIAATVTVVKLVAREVLALAGLSGLFRDEALFAQVNAGFRSVGL